MAICLQIISSFSFATGATLQSLGVKSTFDPSARVSSNKLTFAGLLRLFTIPKWLFGLFFVFLGAAIHLYALTIASVTVVQPVGILAVPWSVLIAAKIHGHKVTWRIWKAVGITVAGVIGFTYFSATNATKDAHLEAIGPIVWSFVVVCVICGALALVATKVAPWARAMLWSSVGAVFYGLASGMMKAALDAFFKVKLPVADPLVWGTALMMLVCYVLGVWMIQQGYASGPAEITVGTMTTVDPFVAVLFGLIVLREGAGMGAGAGIGMAIAGSIAVYGVLLLSRDHPDAVAEREKHEQELSAQSEAARVTD